MRDDVDSGLDVEALRARWDEIRTDWLPRVDRALYVQSSLEGIEDGWTLVVRLPVGSLALMKPSARARAHEAITRVLGRGACIRFVSEATPVAITRRRRPRRAYNGAAPFVEGSDTSEASARAIDATGAPGKDRRKVYDFLVGCALGATDEEIQAGLGMSGNTARPRRCELVEAGSVMDSGLRRRVRSGKMATVWVATPSAPDARSE